MNARLTHRWRASHTTTVLAAAVLYIAALIVPAPAAAIPVFARKYETSCQTCHTAFPKLNPFGEAFRRNGYRFPGADEEGSNQDEPLALGHKVHRKLFPNAVMPGDIPGAVPVAFQIVQKAKLTSELGGGHAHGGLAAVPRQTGGAQDDHNEPLGIEFSRPGAALFTAGTAGKMLSWFAKLEVAATTDGADVELERPNVIFRPFETPALLVRVGSFEPVLNSFSVHRNLTGHNLLSTTVAFGGNAWSPEPEQTGVELSGVLASGRLGYVAGAVEGSSNLGNRAKDFYGRVDYKLGGMRLDGIGGAKSSHPWAEWSVLLGGFGYSGFATFGDPAGGTQTQSDRFWRAGVDVNAMLGDINLVAAIFVQEHERPSFGDQRNGSLRGIFAQADWVIWPWLVATGRYEHFLQQWPDEETGNAQRTLVGANVLMRANVSLRAMANLAQNPGGHFEFEGASFALSTAF